MCPVCIGTAALLVSSGTSAGGFAALFVRQRARKNASIAPCAANRGREHEPEQKDLQRCAQEASTQALR
jgi:hypothetical protein